MTLRTIRDMDVTGKRVLVRVDFNVPLKFNGDGTITDDSRIRASLPTILYLMNDQAKVILCSHLGRPDGKVVEELRMCHISERLSTLINKPVLTVSDCIGDQVKHAVNNLKNGEVLLLENLRFHHEEEQNDPNFSKALAELADIYVNDAFGTAHRSHTSTVGITKYLPAFAGLLMEKEYETLSSLLANPKHPFTAILGGAKVSDKIGLIENILPKIDILLIGGGMAATFLKIRGFEVGKSKVEIDKEDVVRAIIKTIDDDKVLLLLPTDVMVADEINKDGQEEIVVVSNIPKNKFIVDIGPKTIDMFSRKILESGTVFWNGPMGVFEINQFSKGTTDLVKLLANIKSTTIIGGGSTAEIVEEMKLTDKMTHVSTGGGASLTFLEGKILPGLDVLKS